MIETVANPMMVILLLLLAHLMGDFVLQSDQSIEAKRTGKLWPYVVHGLIHAVLAYICVGLWTIWLLPIVIGLTHGVIDWSKEASVRAVRKRWGDPARIARTGILATDQLLHLAVIIGVVTLLVDPEAVPAWREWFEELALAAVIILIGLVITTWCGAYAISFATEPYLEELMTAAKREGKRERERQGEGEDQGEVEREADASGGTPPPPQNQQSKLHAAAHGGLRNTARRGFSKGGRTIGVLERALVFLFVITGNMTGVGFLVAAKSVFRFGEISQPTQRKEAEYIIIGTLMSFTWAIFAAWLTRFALDALPLG